MEGIKPNQTDAEGGAIYHAGGLLQISECWLSSNQAQGGLGLSYRSVYEATGGFGSGGAIFNGAGRVEIGNSAVTLNQARGGDHHAGPAGGVAGAARGGGIYNQGTLAVTNCTFAQNSARGGGDVSHFSAGSAFGGAIFSEGAATFESVTMGLNSVVKGLSPESPAAFALIRGALGASIALTNATAALSNSILLCSAGQTNISGTIIDGGHNLCSDGSAYLTLPTSRSGIDAMLGPLANNGGPTPTMALLPASPAIDNGDAVSCQRFDQRGVARPQGRACDIGAFELAPQLSIARNDANLFFLTHVFRSTQTNYVFGFRGLDELGVTRHDLVRHKWNQRLH